MPRVSLRKMHPGEVAELAALLTELWQKSDKTQRVLAKELHISEASMSRYLSGEAVISPETLIHFLDVTKANPDDRKRATELCETIHRPVPPSSGAGARKGRGKARTLVIAVASAAGLVGVIVMMMVVLSQQDPAPAAPVTRCSDVTPPQPTAWSASCGAKVTLDRANSQFTLTDLAADSSRVILNYQLNNGDWHEVSNSKGSRKPPKQVRVPEIAADTVVKFYVCVRNPDAKNEARRGIRDCGQPITYPSQ